MEFKEGSVGMDLDNCHLGAVVIGVFIEGDQLRLMSLDEISAWSRQV